MTRLSTPADSLMTHIGDPSRAQNAEPSGAGQLRTEDMNSGPPPRLAIVLKRYPRLSETFIAQEILALEKRGLPLTIVSLSRPTDEVTHPIHADIRAPVVYLPQKLRAEPARFLGAWVKAHLRPGYWRALGRWLIDMLRDPTHNRLMRFAQALVFAAETPADVARLHVHFLNTQGTFARYASPLTGLPWSCSAHARDIWTTPDWDLRQKLTDLDWITTCTRAGHGHLAARTADIGRLDLIYHGLDLNRFPAMSTEPRANNGTRTGADADDPVRLLTVGRAVEKKGFDVLLDALARLPADLHWRLEHMGVGEHLEALKAQSARLGLADRVSWRGAQTSETVLEAYRRSDLFVLPCRVAKDNDRDGLPNVLMEAQSQGLACLSTEVSGIPELIEDGVNGVLVPPEDPARFAAELTRLIGDPERRHQLGARGAERIRTAFSHEPGIDRIFDKLSALMPNTRTAHPPAGPDSTSPATDA